MYPDFSVEEVARELRIDRHYLARLFKERYGVTMQGYLIDTRIRRAAELLCGGHSATESAFLCGYTDFSNFSKMFRRRFGVSPGRYAQSVAAPKE
jgi:AraC-like DNA-binding protein